VAAALAARILLTVAPGPRPCKGDKGMNFQHQPSNHKLFRLTSELGVSSEVGW